MAKMLWDTSLNTGISIIDEQHRGIVDYINKLDEAAQANDRDKVTQVLMGLINYTASHFAFEESLLEQNKYPLLDAHKAVHASFVKRIQKYFDAHKAGQNIAKTLSGELQIWLANHIKNEDGDYVKSVNIKTPSGSLLSRMVAKFF
ncbi:bacteriohemerythrin [Microbulbifer sp. SA54]|uniref:bacteriohemerythrin n=1 Tax=Microbulbifer sp. SA54 TaxID=3401577 RepID=UPI003AAE8DA2